jgi:hypothetical protein
LRLKCGDTFILPKRSDQVEHLWIVIAETDPARRLSICVNVTTERPDSDPTCKLNAGDHPFVTHPSVIFYNDAREIDLAQVEKALNAGIKSFVCTLHTPCSPQLLARIQQGLIVSKQTPKGIKAACKKLWGVL